MGEVSVTDRTEGPVTVVTLDGELDSASSPAVQERLTELVQPDTRVLLDLSAVPYMSSAGLRTMLLLYRNAQSVDTSVGLVGVAPELKKMMEATGFLGFFTLHDSVEDGLATAAEKAGGSRS